LNPLEANSFLYDFHFFVGTLITALLLMPLKTFLPRVFDVSFVERMVTDFKFLHPQKALFPIFLTLLPIVTFLSFLLFLKAFAAMEVTLYVTPEIFTVAGIDTLLVFFFVVPEY
jgi:hypothetical protein